MGRLRAAMPGVPDLVFGVVLAVTLIGGRTGFLNDPGTFWHLRLGREILRTGAVPRADTLTYTRESVPWVDQSWAFDAGLALLVDRWGWTAAVVAMSLGLAWLYGALARGLIRDGRTPAAAVLVAVLATGVGSVHFLVRPHMFTMAFVLWTLRACQAQHERGGWALATVPPLMVAWANVHGGFPAGPLIVLTAGIGHAASGPLDAARRRNLAKFVAAFALSIAATLLNPYGLGLYRHVFGLLVSSGVTDLIDEYQPMPFGQEKAQVMEWVVLGLVALPTLGGRRMGRYALAHTLVWLHLALGSIRHAPLFALAAASGLAELLDGLPLAGFRFSLLRRGWSAWPAAVTLAMALAVASGLRYGGFSPTTWPLEGLEALNRQPAGARLFHEQDWGGMIEAQCRPPRRTFLDDRFELFGRPAILAYLDALQGGPGWDALRDRERIDLVWVRPIRGLAHRLARDPGWRRVYRDDVSVLFARARPADAVAGR